MFSLGPVYLNSHVLVILHQPATCERLADYYQYYDGEGEARRGLSPGTDSYTVLCFY